MVMQSGHILFPLAYFHSGSSKGNVHGPTNLPQSVTLCPRACFHLANPLYHMADGELQVDGKDELLLGKIINFYSNHVCYCSGGA